MPAVHGQLFTQKYKWNENVAVHHFVNKFVIEISLLNLVVKIEKLQHSWVSCTMCVELVFVAATHFDTRQHFVLG